MSILFRTLSKPVTKLKASHFRVAVPCYNQSRRLASEVRDDRPVKFSTSKAALWNARNTRGDIQDDSPWFQPIAVLSSVAVFLIYFCVLREENDIDQELNKTLYDRLPGLEKKQLQIVLQYNESQGLDTTAIKNRLEEIDNEENKSN